MSWWNDKPYQSVAERRAMAEKEMEKRRAKGQIVTPISIAGRAIASTFWGKAWCDHIEQLADFESRLAKGKSYVRNGSVCHLEIREGKVLATVAGSEVYDITVEIQPLKPTRWEAIKRQCAGQVGTALELLQGRFSDQVMRVLTDPNTGMFPSTDEFDLDCSCPDFVRLCKHLAAVLYGVGARLDRAPELLFQLRGVDPTELIDEALDAGAITSAAKPNKTTIADADLSDVFGIDIDLTPAPAHASGPAPVSKGAPARVPVASASVPDDNTGPTGHVPRPASNKRLMAGFVNGKIVRWIEIPDRKKPAKRKATKKKKAVGRWVHTGADKSTSPTAAIQSAPQVKPPADASVKPPTTKSPKAKSAKAKSVKAKIVKAAAKRARRG